MDLLRQAPGDEDAFHDRLGLRDQMMRRAPAPEMMDENLQRRMMERMRLRQGIRNEQF
jgi:hypothetical protein